MDEQRDAIVDHAGRASSPATDALAWSTGDGTAVPQVGGVADPVGVAVGAALRDLVVGMAVSFVHHPAGALPEPLPPSPLGVEAAAGPGPAGWDSIVTVRLERRTARLLEGGSSSLGELLATLPAAAIRAAAQLRRDVGGGSLPTPAIRRAARDALAAEILSAYVTPRLGREVASNLFSEVIDYLIELSGMRVEAHDLTHGVVIADIVADEPRLAIRYPDDLRGAKRAPLLFDGQRSVLVVDPQGRARTELQRHRFDRLGGTVDDDDAGEGWADSGSLVARATRHHGGLGFYVRADRSIWTFVHGQPLLVRRGEHWTSFPGELAASISNMIGGGRAAEVVARAAYMISARPQGAILAIIDDSSLLDGVVSAKDRYDLRNEIDRDAMRPETRLHHLLDADDLDEHAVARLAALDGATILDREAGLIAYGAIVSSSDSQHEGARTAAARTLSETALAVLKVSVDGDITIFRDGAPVTTLLGPPSRVIATQAGAPA